MKPSRLLVVKLCLLLLVGIVSHGCSNSDKRTELEAYVKKIKNRQIKEIEPLPAVKPYETFTYNDASLRSPFMPSTPIEIAKKGANDNGIRPDANRRKEPLESFPLDSLRMMGTLEKSGKKWAVVVDPDGVVYPVTKGNYIGQHDGRVDDITEEKMSITEIIPDATGGWRERKASVALVDEEAMHKNKSKDKK